MIFGKKHKPEKLIEMRVYAYFPTQLQCGRWAWHQYIWRAYDCVYRDTKWSYFGTLKERNQYARKHNKKFDSIYNEIIEE